MATLQKPVTESPNAVTANIDVASPGGIVDLLRQTDLEIFSGVPGQPGLLTPDVLTLLEKLVHETARVLRHPKGVVIMSGAGTSGRLAMFTARAMARSYPRPDDFQKFRYTMAGGNVALIAAQEGAEDDPHAGKEDFIRESGDAEAVLFIGITCGLSAPYVAGQLQHFVDSDMQGHAVLLGFNPPENSRNIPVEGWDRTFRDVVHTIIEHPKCSILSPIIGPEPVTGSTRMKSGSATKILLETILHSAMLSLLDEDTKPASLIKKQFDAYQTAIETTYASADSIATIISMAAQSLSNGGRLLYLGGAGTEHYSSGLATADNDIHIETDGGILGLVDASECPPTYGATFEEVRGFVEGGWQALLPGTGIDLSQNGPVYRISTDDFLTDTLPSLIQNDLVVAIGKFPERERLLQAAMDTGAHTAAIHLGWEPRPEHAEHGIALNFMVPPELETPVQLAIKLVLNAITSGAYITNGKVYGNRMVDLKISNNKLYYRAISIISDLMGVESEKATDALLASIYSTDKITSLHRDAPVQHHIERATTVSKVVPRALLIATGKFDWMTSAKVLEEIPVVRTALEKYRHSNNNID